MLVIPAIDIKNGKCVRLTQGDYSREKVYCTDPFAVAKDWEKQGAQMVHIIDLDGAKDGRISNLRIIKSILSGLSIPVQIGGGIRSEQRVDELLSLGAARVILGTIALDDQTELKKIIQNYSSQVAIALDTKNGKLMKQGWLKQSGESCIESAIRLESLGAKRFIYTDVVKDGTLTEPNYEEISRLVKSTSVSVIVGGGISSIKSVRLLKDMGVEGVIIGKALYEGKFDLKEVGYVS